MAPLPNLPAGLLLLATAIIAIPAEAAEIPLDLFPADSIWNTRVDFLPLDPASTDYVAAIGNTTEVHPDFGSGLWNGMSFSTTYPSRPVGSGIRVTQIFSDSCILSPFSHPTRWLLYEAKESFQKSLLQALGTWPLFY